MNKIQIKQLNKKIDKLLSLKKLPTFPLYGGASGGELCRNVTQKESERLRKKRAPVPIKISFKQEKELLKYLNEM